jgi:hemerythrin superfamily protein
MEVSEREKRELLAYELADIFHRQEAVVQCNELLNLATEKVEPKFRQMAEEDEKSLRLIESAIGAFGVRVAPREGAVAMADFILEQLQDENTSPVEQLAFYTMLKQNQMLCCHLVHKSAQISGGDIKLSVTTLDDMYSLIAKQVTTLLAYTEEFGVKWITGEAPQGGIVGRARDAFATVAHAVKAKAGKPMEDMSILTVLATEHRKVDMLFAEIKSCDTLQKANDLFAQLKADLTAHSLAEEDNVYAYYVNLPDLKEQMTHAQREHQELRNLLDEATYLAADEEKFFDTVDRIKEKVQHHVREEEGKIFAAMKKHSTEEELVQLTRKFLEEKRNIQINIGTDNVIASVANAPSSQTPVL